MVGSMGAAGVGSSTFSTGEDTRSALAFCCGGSVPQDAPAISRINSKKPAPGLKQTGSGIMANLPPSDHGCFVSVQELSVITARSQSGASLAGYVNNLPVALNVHHRPVP